MSCQKLLHPNENSTPPRSPLLLTCVMRCRTSALPRKRASLRQQCRDRCCPASPLSNVGREYPLSSSSQDSLAAAHDFTSLLCRAENSREIAPASLSPTLPVLQSVSCRRPLGGQTIELGAAIVLWERTFFERNPSALDEPGEALEIKRPPLFYLQDVVGIEFDGFGDGVARARAPSSSVPKNQQVQWSLAAVQCVSFSSLVVILGERVICF